MKDFTDTDKAYINGLMADHKEQQEAIEKIRSLRDDARLKMELYDEVLKILGYHESQYEE